MLGMCYANICETHTHTHTRTATHTFGVCSAFRFIFISFHLELNLISANDLATMTFTSCAANGGSKHFSKDEEEEQQCEGISEKKILIARKSEMRAFLGRSKDRSGGCDWVWD